MNLCQTVYEYPGLWIFSNLQILTTLLLEGLGRNWVIRLPYGWHWRSVSSIRLTEIGLWARIWYKQISDVFHVDFKERNCYSKLGIVWILFYIIENLMDWSWHDSTLIIQFPIRLTAKNCVGFTRPSLSKCHNDSVKSTQNIINNWLGKLFISIGLVGCHVENIVK